MATILSLVFVLAAVLGNVTPAAALAAWPTVRNGDSGPNVKTVQYLLRQRGSTIPPPSRPSSPSRAPTVSPLMVLSVPTPGPSW
jgi:hypothetical protein